MNLWDIEVWQAGIETKTTLTVYKQFKTNLSERNWFDNIEKSVVMLRARLNTLNVNWRKEHSGGSHLCDSEVDNLEHFLFCVGYSEVRQIPASAPTISTNTTELIGNILILTNIDNSENKMN